MFWRYDGACGTTLITMLVTDIHTEHLAEQSVSYCSEVVIWSLKFFCLKCFPSRTKAKSFYKTKKHKETWSMSFLCQCTIWSLTFFVKNAFPPEQNQNSFYRTKIRKKLDQCHSCANEQLVIKWVHCMTDLSCMTQCKHCFVTQPM